MEEPKFEPVPEETAETPAELAEPPAADEVLIPEMPEEPAAPAEDPMVEVCDVQFRSGSKVYFFAPGELKIATGDEVILETARGPEFGQCVRVRLEQQPDTIVCHHNCDICVLRNGKARKTDPPIPDDLAPISGNPQKCRKKEAPELKTYLEPVVMRQNAAVLEEARTNEADIQNEQQRGKRRRRGGRGRRHEGEGEVPQEQEARRPAEAKKPAEPKKPAESKKPAEARKLAEARPEQAEGEPKKQRPRRQRPPRAPKPEGEKPPRAEAAPVDVPHGGEKPKPRRRSRGHRKPGGPKPEGGGEV